MPARGSLLEPTLPGFCGTPWSVLGPAHTLAFVVTSISIMKVNCFVPVTYINLDTDIPSLFSDRDTMGLQGSLQRTHADFRLRPVDRQSANA